MEQNTKNSSQLKEKTNEKKLIAVSQWNRYHDFPTVGALRNLIFKASVNGFNKCLKKVGGRLYIEETAFFDWVEERSEQEKKGDF